MPHNANIKNITVDYDTWNGSGSGGGGGGGIPSDGLVSIAVVTDNYMGSFKLADGSYGRGIIAYNSDDGTLFCDDHTSQGMPIFESEIPALVDEDTDLNALNTATILQSSTSIFPKIQSTEWSSSGGDHAFIWGMHYAGGKLYCNGVIGYDANNPPTTDTTIRIEDPSDLANTAVAGCFKGSEAHSLWRWMTPTPADHLASIGKDHILGAGNGVSIVGRLSKGPSLGGVDISDLAAANDGDTVATENLMNWLDQWINPDYMNYGGASGGTNNDMYVTTSIPTFGFIVGNSYIVLGYSEGWDPTPLNDTQAAIDGYSVESPGSACSNPYVGTRSENGVNSGVLNGAIVYKNNSGSWTNSVGVSQGGYFCHDVQNRGPFYWIFSLPDIYAAKSQGNLNSVLPYEYGPFPVPFSKTSTTAADGKSDAITSATLDSANKILYVALGYANNSGDENYNGPPVVAAYSLSGVM